MQLDWSQLLSRRVLAWAGGVLALVVFFPTLFHLGFPSHDEISIESDTGITTCIGLFIDDAEDARSCVTDYHIVIGNTGTVAQEHIAVILAPPPEMFRFSGRALDIVASAERGPVPVIRQQATAGALELHVDNLHPNRLVEISFSTRGVAAYEALQAMTTTVLADGTVIATNPRVTVLARFAQALFGLFGV